ncbi:MAG TPA: molybdenum ABC transporter ATP-binding protein [Stellaceae bacterium]|nr:molybdenum ABC transporter ATP-binding protein [Stellaceae bacterium]
MIEVFVTKRLGGFTLDASFFAAASGITALFGRSGAGKTSLVNALAGLLRPDAGRIVVRGEVLFDAARGIDVPPERRRLGYVFQESLLFPHYSVRGNLLYGRRGSGADAARRFDATVALLGLEALLERRPNGLSGGEKQRVALGRALLAEPRLLLMDEPLAALDAPRKAEILPFIERLRDEMGVPIVYVTHQMEEIVRLADTLVLLSEGRVAAIGSVEDLSSRLDLRPLTGRYEAGAVIRAEIAAHDPEFGLTQLAFPGGRLNVARLDLPTGTKVRVRVRARDVVLSTAPQAGLSIRNSIPGRVVEIASDPGPIVDLRLDIGTGAQPVILWARITRRALTELELAPGSPVHAMVKTVALDRGSFARYAPGVPALGESEAS